MNCMICNKINIIDDDYKMCYNCYFYYDKHNPKVIDDFENGLLIKEEKSNKSMYKLR